MANKEAKVEVKSAAKYSARDLIASAKYAADRDILSALLDKSKTYSFDDVDRIIEKFKKTRV